MAIKIDNKDLSKRIYNWQEVQRVILNGSQIRPTEESHIDYHVISDFTWWGGWGGGWLPWWWGWYDVETTADWIIAGRSGTWTITYSSVRWMPSLANAKKIEVVVNFGWDVSTPEFTTALINLSLKNNNTQYIGGLIRYAPYSDSYSQITMGGTWNFTNVTSWNYTMVWDINMEDIEYPFVTLETDWPSTFSSETVRREIDTPRVFNIRSCNNFDVTIKEWITVKSVDFYIWNN